MRGTSATDLLELWESAADCAPAERALHLLAFALPNEVVDALADFDLGLRDWHLLRLRRALFGTALEACADCPHCGQGLELFLDANELQSDTPPAVAPHYIAADGTRYRLPCSRDLIAIGALDDTEVAARALFARCRVEPIAGDGDLDEVENGLATLAAERAMQLELQCAACGESWQLDFDPGTFVWEEIQARALALLDEVHQLASAYGWSERAILAMSDARRAAYLRMVS